MTPAACLNMDEKQVISHFHHTLFEQNTSIKGDVELLLSIISYLPVSFVRTSDNKTQLLFFFDIKMYI